MTSPERPASLPSAEDYQLAVEIIDDHFERNGGIVQTLEDRRRTLLPSGDYYDAVTRLANQHFVPISVGQHYGHIDRALSSGKAHLLTSSRAVFAGYEAGELVSDTVTGFQPLTRRKRAVNFVPELDTPSDVRLDVLRAGGFNGATGRMLAYQALASIANELLTNEAAATVGGWSRSLLPFSEQAEFRPDFTLGFSLAVFNCDDYAARHPRHKSTTEIDQDSSSAS